MSWLASIGVGLCSGVIGFLVTFFGAILVTDWYRVPQREGAAAIASIAIALLVFIACVALGIVCARHVASNPSPTFMKALSFASAIIAGITVVALPLAWLLSDPPPKIDGSRLELFIELRGPAGFVMPQLGDPSEANATIILLPGGDTRGWSLMTIAEAREEDGRLVIPTLLELDTTVPKKLLSIHLGKDHELQFTFDFGAKPKAKDMEWSRWITATTHPTNTSAPAPQSAFQMRYRVQKEPPPPRVLTDEEFEAEKEARIEAEVQAFAPDAPLADWLRFTRYGHTDARQKEVAASIRARANFVQEMSQAMLSGEPEVGQDAMRALVHITPRPTELAPAVTTVGDEIANSLRELKALPPGDPARDPMAVGISLRFSAWMEATRALQGQADLSFVPQLQEIANQARESHQQYVISMDVLRVASFYLKEWAGIEPLPGDPPPR